MLQKGANGSPAHLLQHEHTNDGPDAVAAGGASAVLASVDRLNTATLISPAASAAIGGLAGIIEVGLQQPSVSWKNAIQDKRTISLNLRVLYRGVLVNAGSMMPINAVQFGVNGYLEQQLESYGMLNDLGRAGVAGVAGAVSVAVTCPAELVMIQQQKLGGTLLCQARDVMLRNGLASFYRGVVPNIARDTVYTAAYLGVNPIMRCRLQAGVPALSERPFLAMISSSLISGVAAAVITQPFDTIKTRMQSNLELQEMKSMVKTGIAMWHEGGFRRLWSGLLPRAQRIACAVFILGEAKDRLTDIYLKFV
eukprot:SM000034S12773  [mRNA]  locus=s34:600068:601992:- [translate_table: standard]